MPRRLQPLSSVALTIALMLALVATGLFVSTVGAADEFCPAPVDPTFEQDYIDTSRAGGEPIITTLDDGTLLWGSHAGTTHFYSPAALSEPAGVGNYAGEYEGQTYYYFSEDDGKTWDFAERAPVETVNPDSGVYNSGSSDPEFAIDSAGNVYVSEINLVNIAVSKSSDGGRSYALQNVLGLTMSDRQWMEADEEDVLYMSANTFTGGSLGDTPPGFTGSTANRMYKSVDGGATWSRGQQLFGSRQMSSDFKIDRRTGALYMLDTNLSGRLELVVAPNARSQMPPNLTTERYVVATDYNNLTSIGPTLDLDAHGNVYIVWDHDETQGRAGGIWFTAAKAGALDAWTTPVRVDSGTETAQWPWLVAGDPGNVSITWLENAEALPNQDSERATGDWFVMAAQTTTAFGCGEATLAGFNEVVASTDGPGGAATAVHTGTMCNSGTTCQAFATDRRLGDYFSNELDGQGNTVIAVSDTNQGGPVSLPLVIRQVSGQTLGQGALAGAKDALAGAQGALAGGAS